MGLTWCVHFLTFFVLQATQRTVASKLRRTSSSTVCRDRDFCCVCRNALTQTPLSVAQGVCNCTGGQRRGEGGLRSCGS